MPWGIEAPLDSMYRLVPDTDSKMRGSVVSCEMRRELYLSFALGTELLNVSVPQSLTALFSVPDTVTATIFPTLQTTAGTLAMLQSTKDGDTEYLSVYID